MYKGSLVIAGECMCTRPFSMHDEPEFLELIKILREADTTYCHLEMNIFPKGGYPGKAFAVSALQADPIIANELKWAGIDLVSCAYNHTTDWGLPGVLGTIETLDTVGLVHAGTGNNLEEAREPSYFESRSGRVAIISMSSGHHPNDSASSVKAPARGRPGVNPLRVTQKYVVTPEILEHLKEAWNNLGLSMKPPEYMGPGEEGDTYLNAGGSGTLIFRVGDKPEVQSIPDKWDVEGNLRAIKDARRQADLVVVAHHTYINEGKRGYEPCKFVTPFARECIDAGADVYVGHGWHRQLGIEIYKGKPIMYGTGNFFAQSHFLTRLPADAYEGNGFDLDDLPNLTPSDLFDSKETHRPHWLAETGNVIATLSMEEGRFNGMRLYPISLGYDFGMGPKTGQVRETWVRIEGRPTLTHRENAERIIDHIKKLSKAFNTRIDYKDGIGIVAIK